MSNPPPPPAGDGREYLVRSQEQLRVETERVVAGYARLEKFVVTETQTFTVQVSHEEFRVVQEPAPHAEGGRPVAPDRSGQLNTARWLYAHREEIVVTTRLVPTERARLEVYPITQQRGITEPVRIEQLDATGLGPDPSAHT